MKEERIASEDLRVLIVDDHKLVRQGIKYSLEIQDKYNVSIDEAEDGQMAIKLAECFNYDIILMDINMPKMNGTEATKKIIQMNPDSKILSLSMHDEAFQIKNMLIAGASGYLLKNTGSEELINAIQSIHEGNKYFCSEVAVKLITDTGDDSVNVAHVVENRIENRKVKLSKREVEVLTLIANEFTNEEISKKLSLSKRTIDSHRQNILNKLGVRNTAGLIRYAIEQGII